MWVPGTLWLESIVHACTIDRVPGTSSGVATTFSPERLTGCRPLSSCGVPPSLLLRGAVFDNVGSTVAQTRVPSSPNIVTGGTLGERAERRPRRVSGSRGEQKADDSALCGRAGFDVSRPTTGGFIAWR
jgi:hypothetical protein